MVTVNTNKGAMAAIQDLRVVGQSMAKSQAAIATGSKVSSVQGAASSWVLAKQTSSDVSAYNRVRESTDRASAMLDTAMAAGAAIMDLLDQMKSKALAGTQTTNSASVQAALAADYLALRQQIGLVVANAQFEGSNMVGPNPASAIALGDADGNNSITIAGADLSYGTPIMQITAFSHLTGPNNATVALGLVNSTITTLGNQMATWAAGAKRLETHRELTSKIQMALDTKFSSLNDADLTAESAKLKAAQTREQLATQAFAVANATTRSALSLFP
ncbi:flagellin [Aquidulcibacter sp.]|uniref:flagellin n=1 Tax=Aquidulcibacter sp. TaxID=2052990 RepID=UPI003BA57519